MELRKDYILDKWVIIAADRKKRPQEFRKESMKDTSVCFFCPGKEDTTPKEIGRLEKDGNWQIRWFPNKFAFLEPKGKSNIETHNNYFTFSDAFGYHEVIVETRDHEKQLWDLTEDQISDLIKVYNNRIESLSKMTNINYVSIFKNHGQSRNIFDSFLTQVAAQQACDSKNS
jgi:UDPglucose--hexose-1-phosphate uridylyltransferase